MSLRKEGMTYQELDFIFPFVVFAYGAVMTFVTNSKFLMEIAEKRFTPELHQQFNGHRNMGIVCLFVGALWSLQNLW